MGTIYKITNIQNDNFYVGKTQQLLRDRFRGHKKCYEKGTSTYLYNAMRKYGFDSFKIEAIEENIDNTLLNEREIFWIQNLQPQYNMTKGGDGGNVMRPEKREYFAQIRSQKMKGINNPFYGKKHSAETKKHLSNIRKGKPSPHKGKKRSEAALLNIRESAKKRKTKGITAWNKGIPRSDDQKINQSNKMRGKNGITVCFYDKKFNTIKEFACYIGTNEESAKRVILKQPISEKTYKKVQQKFPQYSN